MDLKTISIEDIIFQADNPRLTFFDESLEELSRSLKQDGIIEPIVVRPHGSKYDLIVGERRVRAAIRANIPKIPAVIREDITDEEASRLRLVENINRKDLDVFEKVIGIKAHMKQYGKSIEAIAAELGKQVETVKSWIRIAENTSPKIKIEDNFIRSLGTQKLMEISKYTFETQERLAEKIVSEDLTVDQVRRFATLFESNPDADLDLLVRKVKQQVKTIEVTLPIDEANKLQKRAREIRLKDKKAEDKLKNFLRKKNKLEKTANKEAIPPSPPRMEQVDLPTRLHGLENVRETELARLTQKEQLSQDEIDRVTDLNRNNPDTSPKEIVDMVKRQTRAQVMVLEIPPSLYNALEAYATTQNAFLKQAAILLLEEGLESHGYWRRGGEYDK
jgi:ParB family chromosome partitioning protein